MLGCIKTNKTTSLLSGWHCFIILEVACTQRKVEQKDQQTLCCQCGLFLSQVCIETTSACLSFFVCFVLREVVRFRAQWFVVFPIVYDLPLTQPGPCPHLQMPTCWPSRNTSLTSWTTSWSRRRAGTSLSAGMDWQMDRSQSHARYGFKSSLIGGWVEGVE